MGVWKIIGLGFPFWVGNFIYMNKQTLKMGHNINDLPYRQTTRLQNWDYGFNGTYFITICTKNKKPYFGEIQNSILLPTIIGMEAEIRWKAGIDIYDFIELDSFVIMPEHMHGIIRILERKDNDKHHNKFGPQKRNLATVIRGYKSGVKSFALNNNIEFEWQPRYYERLIRNIDDLTRTRQYITNNPSKYPQ
jgi:REP element-mobilizing transposase RayT